MRIIVDAFGGDHAPLEILKGAALAVAEYGHTVILTGDEAALRRLAEEQHISLDGIELADAKDVITMEEDPRSILREHRECSMAVGLDLLSKKKGDAMVSAGSTGALLIGSTFFVKRIKGVSRAALAMILPGDNGPFLLTDVGANAECRPEMLLQFAQMGNIYMSKVMGDGTPSTVGLLNIGTEETKGDPTHVEAFQLLKESGLNFVGNVEAREMPTGNVNVVIADGFSGNVALKTMEGTAQMIMRNVKRVFMKSWYTKLAALMIKGGLKSLKKKMDITEYGGAPLLGIAAPVIKAHGNSNANAIKNAIRVAADFAASGAIDAITAVVKETKDPTV